jgi:hypothetical protein
LFSGTNSVFLLSMALFLVDFWCILRWRHKNLVFFLFCFVLFCGFVLNCWLYDFWVFVFDYVVNWVCFGLFCYHFPRKKGCGVYSIDLRNLRYSIFEFISRWCFWWWIVFFFCFSL